MKKIVLLLVLGALVAPLTLQKSEASLISNRSYRAEMNKENRKEIKQIKNLFKIHETYANNHDLKGLETLYSDKYMNNDGFGKEVYFKSIKETWDTCKDLTYETKIVSINVSGDYASINVEETANGTITDMLDSNPIAGELHSKSTGIYYLEKVNEKWFIVGETALTDESSLLYGDARFMNIEIQAPNQVSAGDIYTTTVKVDGKADMFIIGAIDRDPVTYPANTPKSELRAMPQSQTLERLLKANTDNLNEYAVASLAISKAKNVQDATYQIYMAGLVCVMKRVNVIPKNNFIKVED